MKYYITPNATIAIDLPSAMVRFTPADRLGGLLRGVHATDDTKQQLELADAADEYGIREISVDRYNQLISRRGTIQSSVSYDPARTQAPLAGSVAPKPKPEPPIAPEADKPKELTTAEEHEQQLEDLTETEEAEEPKPDPEEVEEVVEYARTHADLVPFLGGPSEEDLKIYSRRKGAPKRSVRGHSIQEWKIFLEGQVDEQEAEEVTLSETE